MTSPPSSRTAIMNVERVRSDGLSKSSATCWPASGIACAPAGAARGLHRRRQVEAALELARREVENRQESLRCRPPRSASWHCSCSILRVDLHVVGAQIARPHPRRAGPPGSRDRRRADVRRPAGTSAACGARSSNGRPSANSSTSPMRTGRASSSKATPARPATATRRPQFGSPPCTAVLTSGELAIARAACLASVVAAAAGHWTVTSLVAPFTAAHDADRQRLADRRSASTSNRSLPRRA